MSVPEAHLCGVLPIHFHPPTTLPRNVDEFVAKAIGCDGEFLLKGSLNDPALFRVEVDLRDLALLVGPAWREAFIRVTNIKAARITAGHANH